MKFDSFERNICWTVHMRMQMSELTTFSFSTYFVYNNVERVNFFAQTCKSMSPFQDIPEQKQ